MNAMHSSMKITDEFYSNLNDDEVQIRIGSIGKSKRSNDDDQEALSLFKDFLTWKQGKSSHYSG